MKADWEGWITLFATRAIRLVNTLMKILKLTLSRQMGRYCCICVTSFCFGNNIIAPKLRLKRGKVPLWNSSIRGHKVLFYYFSKDLVELSQKPIRSRRFLCYIWKITSLISLAVETSFSRRETCGMSCIADYTIEKWSLADTMQPKIFPFWTPKV